MAIDLSAASGDGLKLILLRVPAKDLIGKCTQVSKRWKGILDDNDFWRNKMEEDGYLWQDKICENGNKLEWRKFADLPTKLFKLMALKHCFERNLLKDIWNLEAQDGQVVTFDPRWKGADECLEPEEDIVDVNATVLPMSKPRIEIPPKFVDGEPEIPQTLEKPIAACIAVACMLSKFIVIELADEGLTDEIMDNFRPTIFVTAMIANRRDCSSEYLMQCSLSRDAINRVDLLHIFRYDVPYDQRELWDECRDENGRFIRATIGKRFNLGEGEGWHRMMISIKDYPAGMRYLYLRCFARVRGPGPIPEIQKTSYGIKLANCSIKALLEKNATE